MIPISLVALLLAAPGLQPVSADAYRHLIQSGNGRVRLVDFWATWCEPCRDELPLVAALSSKFDGRQVQLITISSDDPENRDAALRLLRKTGVSGPWFIKAAVDDGAFINTVDPTWSGALPAFFLYDKRGKLVRQFIGEVEIAEIERAVHGLL